MLLPASSIHTQTNRSTSRSFLINERELLLHLNLQVRQEVLIWFTCSYYHIVVVTVIKIFILSSFKLLLYLLQDCCCSSILWDCLFGFNAHEYFQTYYETIASLRSKANHQIKLQTQQTSRPLQISSKKEITVVFKQYWKSVWRKSSTKETPQLTKTQVV